MPSKIRIRYIWNNQNLIFSKSCNLWLHKFSRVKDNTQILRYFRTGLRVFMHVCCNLKTFYNKLFWFLNEFSASYTQRPALIILPISLTSPIQIMASAIKICFIVSIFCIQFAKNWLKIKIFVIVLSELVHFI